MTEQWELVCVLQNENLWVSIAIVGYEAAEKLTRPGIFKTRLLSAPYASMTYSATQGGDFSEASHYHIGERPSDKIPISE